jgi:hypothetical protein
MTLHEAIVRVLQAKGTSMTTQEIADELNRNGLYSKRNGSAITDFQIHGRTRNYGHLFHREGSTVSLRSKTGHDIPEKRTNAIQPQRKLTKVEQLTDELALKVLMNENNFKSAGGIDKLVLDRPGLYCIRIDKPESLPEPFATYLKDRNHNIIYIGIATQSLKTRFLGQELRAKGHGTFFRGIGAVLGYKPPKGSLVNKKNKNNYKFSPADNKKIIEWINAHFVVNWVEFSGDFESTETMLVKKYLPILNTSKNPEKLAELAALRKECRDIADQLILKKEA